MLNFEYCQRDIYKSDFHSVNLLFLICEHSSFDIKGYLNNLKNNTNNYRNVFYRTFMCMSLASRLYKCSDNFNKKTKEFFEFAQANEKPGVQYKFYDRLFKFSETQSSNSSDLADILNSPYIQGVNNFLYVLPSCIDKNSLVEVAQDQKFSSTQLRDLSHGIMNSYGIWHDIFEYCDSTKITECIQTFNSLNIRTFHYYILCTLVDENLICNEITNHLNSMEKFRFLLFLNRFNKIDLFKHFLSLFEKSFTSLENFENKIEILSLLNTENLHPNFQNHINSFKINDFEYSIVNSPYILHYYRNTSIDLPDDILLANKVSPSTAYSFVPASSCT